MICAFVDNNFNYEMKELQTHEAASLTQDKQYFSICVDNDYYIFFDREIYVEANMEKIAKLLTKLNLELIVQNQK